MPNIKLFVMFIHLKSVLTNYSMKSVFQCSGEILKKVRAVDEERNPSLIY